MSLEFDPNTADAECIAHLEAEIEPVALVALARRRHQLDTAYDHFLYDFVGDPYLTRQPVIERHYPFVGDRNYTERLLASYSREGSLVHVRTLLQCNSEHRAHDFFVVSADLHEQTITQWRINEANFSGAGDSLRLELVLSDTQFEELQSIPSLCEQEPLRRIIERKRAENNLIRTQHSQPRVILTSQGCWFSKAGSPPESLAPIGELVRKVDSLYSRFGHVALLRTEEYQTERTDTIAA